MWAKNAAVAVARTPTTRKTQVNVHTKVNLVCRLKKAPLALFFGLCLAHCSPYISHPSLVLRFGFMWAFGFGAMGVKAQSVVSNHKPFRFGDGFLPLLDLLVKKLFHPTTI